MEKEQRNVPIMSEEFYRIKRLPPYVIAEVNAMRAAARAAGEDIIDLGMGNPDLPPPDHVIEKLCEVARKRSEEHTSELQSLLRISYAVFCLQKTIKEPST